MPENIAEPKVNTAVQPVPTQIVPNITVVLPSNGGAVEQPQQPKEELDNTVDTLIPSDPYYTDPLFYEVANYFDLKEEDYESAKNKMSEIVDYIIRDIKSNAPEQVLLALRLLENKLHPPSWGERRYTNVYKYIRLAAKSRSTQQAMKAFEKGGQSV